MPMKATYAVKRKQIKKGLMRYAPTRKLLGAHYKFMLRGSGDSVYRYLGMPVLSYARAKKKKYHLVEKSRVREVIVREESIPKGTGSRETGFILCAPHYVAELDDAIITAGSESIITGNYYLNDRIKTNPAFSVDISASPEYYLASDFCERHIFTKRIPVSREIGRAISLVGRWPSHIWHLSVEILPRLRLIESCPEYDGIPILMDEEAFGDPRNAELLDMVNIRKYPVIKVPKGESWRVKKLIYPSQTAPQRTGYYDNMQLSGKKKNETGIYLYPDEKSIDFLRERVIRKQTKPEKKFFITRRDSRLINEKELAAYFAGIGFEIYDPESLTFQQEVDFFSNARCVVGTIGGALTNCIYCPSEATVCVIMPDNFTDAMFMPQAGQHIGFQTYVMAARLLEGWQVPGSSFEFPVSQCRDVAQELGLG